MAAFLIGAAATATAQAPKWTRLPSIPDREGFAGPFAGTSGGVLIVAGGANFPDKKPWESGTKVWYDKVFVLEKSDGEWRAVGKLLQPAGYGVSVTDRFNVVCVGGSSATRHYRSMLRLAWHNSELLISSGPTLPKPLANMCGALIGDSLFLAGGTSAPDATAALPDFLMLDLREEKAQWKRLKSWPGRERMLAIAGAYEGAFYLFGGCALRPGADGKPERDWLRDAYRFKPGQGWKRIADLPRVAVAAPSPAPVVNGKILILGGDDGAQVNTPPTEHKGFPRSVLAYDPKTDHWTTSGEVPFSLVTTPAVQWDGRIVVPGGEARPGVRSTEVWSAKE